ncbi:uncharacterized protein LOC143186258 [Calliopsis andreniformis]|uniref:uncharacterized protein LOC143186258 n=1 Tax=Calliopsis andreniformis TaxID=337506 RepID=UPI003FCCE6E3
MLFLAVAVLVALLSRGVVGEKSKKYQMNDVCKKYFMRDLYRKIDGAVLISQNERDLDCTITFQTHSILQRFMLRFDQLQLDCNDHLYIYDGAHAVSSYKADLSCRNTKQTVGAIYTRTNFVTLKYVTDSWGTNANGFRLVITAVKDPKHTCKDFRCTENKFCIETDLLCDGVNHCGDGSDEATSTLCANSETSTILGMQTIWFAVALGFVILNVAGIVTVAVLCFCRQRATTPRHPHNAHNAQTHPPVSFPCELQKATANDPPSGDPNGPIKGTNMNHSTAWKILRLYLLTIWTRYSLSMIIQPPANSNALIEYKQANSNYFIGPCLISNTKTCPDEEITFFLYTKRNPEEGQQVLVDSTDSNLHTTNFVPSNPTKIVIHGYDSDMQLSYLVDVRREYLKTYDYNIIAVDWHRLAAGPCYPIVVGNVPHVGDCLAQLIERLRDTGATDIHAIGFSLGAHVPAFAANVLQPYKLYRITGLDPAMPLFITNDNDAKLDKSDAEFVDVFHTDAFIQGKAERSGHVDFYMNGGFIQPGCWETRRFFKCDHHRAVMYFAESINSDVGFWGWQCRGFFYYVLGMCPQRPPAVLAGDKVDRSKRGFYLVKTNSHSPYAMGNFSI